MYAQKVIVGYIHINDVNIITLLCKKCRLD